jgi:23S rRNA (adenine2030-N6)-methyltransferase
VHAREGGEALTALLPLPERRGLILIAPPYEAPDELTRAARALGPALRRFGHGMYLWWRPLKSERALMSADAEAQAQGASNVLRADLWIAPPSADGKLKGSSLYLINPPYGLDVALREALPAIAKRLSPQAGWRVSG